MIVAIDGPAGTGKSTVARAVAEHFGFAYLDTGAMYRALALAAAEHSLQVPGDNARIIELAQSLSIALRNNGRNVFIGERDISEAIRTPQVGALASAIAAVAEVREVMVQQQRRLAEECADQCGGAVLEGRDIQTVVCPHAEVKIFLTAEVFTRAARRLHQWQTKGDQSTIDEAQRDVLLRDERDSTRAASPLRAAPDAIIVATDHQSAEAVIERIVSLVQQKLDEQRRHAAIPHQ